MTCHSKVSQATEPKACRRSQQGIAPRVRAFFRRAPMILASGSELHKCLILVRLATPTTRTRVQTPETGYQIGVVGRSCSAQLGLLSGNPRAQPSNPAFAWVLPRPPASTSGIKQASSQRNSYFQTFAKPPSGETNNSLRHYIRSKRGFMHSPRDSIACSSPGAERFSALDNLRIGPKS